MWHNLRLSDPRKDLNAHNEITKLKCELVLNDSPKMYFILLQFSSHGRYNLPGGFGCICLTLILLPRILTTSV